MVINIIILIALVASALWTVMTPRLPRSAMGLGITSAILTIVMFKLASPLAAVFELSICAGLISAIFISIISLMPRVTAQDRDIRKKEHFRKYWLLPVIIVVAAIAIALSQFSLPTNFNLPEQPVETDVRIILWNLRHLDLLGQIVILLAGAFGVAILFKERKND